MIPPSEKRLSRPLCYSRGSRTFQRFPRLRGAALRVGARIAGQFQDELRFCGAGSPGSTLLLFPRFGRLVRPSRKAAEECLRLVSRRPALDARGIDVGWLA